MMMNEDEILHAVDDILNNLDNTDVTYRVIKQELMARYDEHLIDAYKARIKEFLMRKISESLNLTTEIQGLPLEDDDEIITRNNGRGFHALVQLSPALEDLLGESHLSRPEVIKRIWRYIKANNLQDPMDRRFILCDEKLYNIFKKRRVNIFRMQQPLSAMMKNIKDLQDMRYDVCFHILFEEFC